MSAKGTKVPRHYEIKRHYDVQKLITWIIYRSLYSNASTYKLTSLDIYDDEFHIASFKSKFPLTIETGPPVGVGM